MLLSCVVSRQDEREIELRDENFKLHNKYSEVINTFIMFVENLSDSFLNMKPF